MCGMQRKKLIRGLCARTANWGVKLVVMLVTWDVTNPKALYFPQIGKNAMCYYANIRALQLKSLHKKIAEHQKSEAHKTATNISDASNKKGLKNCVDSLNKSVFDTTCRIFRTAYCIAQHDRPYSDHPHLVELQELNMGKNKKHLGVGLHSRYSATEIVDHVAAEMRRNICQQIKSNDGKISVLIDEATALGNTTTLIIYLLCESDKTCEPHFMFLDLVELKDQQAETICASLLKCLAS